VSSGPAVAILLIGTIFVLWFRPWIVQSGTMGIGRIVACGIGAVATLISAFVALVFGHLSLIENPKYAHYVICEPCF
jgi:hypothetical protein